MVLTSYFVKNQNDPLDLIRWRIKKTNIDLSAGSVALEVEGPEFWSDFAIDITATRYFRKIGIKSSRGCEQSIRALIERIAKYFSVIAGADGSVLAGELKYILSQQMAAFNSPVWFNCGLYHAYGLSSTSENWRYDVIKKESTPVGNHYEYPQTSACFIQSVKDDLLDIFELAKKEAKVFKYGSGTGTNFSCLRSNGESLENGGRSSGLISFLEVLDKGAGAVKSGGLARRAAKMVCVDVDHPEIESFICWKSSEEQKAKALIEKGFSNGMLGDAYRTVSGQNSNNSVRVTDKFMQAVETNSVWSLVSRTQKQEIKKNPAQDLWKLISKCAWECGDPGLQFHDTIQTWHTCPNGGTINASNPCSEFMFLDDSACNLASLNLLKYLSPSGDFLINDFIATIKTLIFSQDLLVSNSSYPTAEIAYNSYHYRPLGIGFANLGAFFMSKGISYDSEEALAWASFISALLTGVAYRTSCELAKEYGAFAKYKENKSDVLRVLNLHRECIKGIEKKFIHSDHNNLVENIWSEVIQLADKHGVRNAQVSAIAPTGTIGLVMDCSTMGVEPEYALYRKKFLVEGTSITLLNKSFERGLSTLGYERDQIEKIINFVLAGKAKDLKLSGLIREADTKVFDCAVDLSALSQLKMVAAIQPFISGAISKTVNLSQEKTAIDIADIFMAAWKMKLKSISVYRDQSKMFQPLVSKT